MAKKQKNKQSVSRKIRPIGVSILSVLAYIGAVFTLIGGIAMVAGSTLVSTLIEKLVPEYASWSTAGVALLLFLGIVFILLAVLDYFIGRGLWNGKNWARILVLIFLVLSILSSLSALDIVSIVIAALLIWYLGFNQNVKNYFG